MRDEPMEPMPEEKPMSSPRLFWELLKSESTALLFLNLAFVAACLPLVTIPPAIFALNQTVRRFLNGEAGEIKHFLAAFKQNWKQGWGAFLLVCVPMGVAGYGMNFYLRIASENWIAFLPFMLCSTVFLAALLASVYLYRLLVNGKPLDRETVRLALALALGRPLRAVLGAVWYYVPLILAILWFPLSLVYLLLIGFSMPCLLGNIVLRKAPPPVGGQD